MDPRLTTMLIDDARRREHAQRQMQLAALMRIQASLNAQAQQQQRILAHIQHQQITAQIHTTTWLSRGPTSPPHASLYQTPSIITPLPTAQTRPAYVLLRSGPIGSDGGSFVSNCDLGDSVSRPSVPRSGPVPPSASEIDNARGDAGAVVYGGWEVEEITDDGN
jgi:hypothetical protein